MSVCRILEPNRTLLNPFFQGYKLDANTEIVLGRERLPADIEIEPTLEKYCVGEVQNLASLTADLRWNALKVLFTSVARRYFMMDHGLTIWELNVCDAPASQMANFHFQSHGRLPVLSHSRPCQASGQKSNSLPDLIPLFTPTHGLLFIANDALGQIYFYQSPSDLATVPLELVKGQVLSASFQAASQECLVLSYEIRENRDKEKIIHVASYQCEDHAQFIVTATAIQLDTEKLILRSTRILYQYQSTTYPELALFHTDTLLLGSQMPFRLWQQDKNQFDDGTISTSEMPVLESESELEGKVEKVADFKLDTLPNMTHPVSLDELLDEDSLPQMEQDDSSCDFACHSFSLTDGRLVSSLSFLDHGWIHGCIPISGIEMNNQQENQLILAAQYDVDALLYHLDPCRLTAHHIKTLHAFGYVQASKRDKKFIAIDPDSESALIVEWQSHAYLYQSKNVESGDKTAPQWIIHFEANEQVIGVQSFRKAQFLILTTRHIYLIGNQNTTQ